MAVILGWVAFSVALVMLPFWVMGWLFAGWRPFLVPLVLWGLAVFVFQMWSFGWLYLPFQYLLAVAGYSHGGTVRTGKKVEQLMNPSPSAGDQ